MADISKCIGEDCSIKERCYRYTVKAKEFWQSRNNHKQEENGNCNHFLDNE